jgi:2-octaprenyl-6-methoxyphenol hydroxylase
MKDNTIFDIIIIGGGLAGLTMASLLGQHKFKVLCLDKESKEKTVSNNFDTRTTAISYGSSLVLTEAGIWDQCKDKSCPILDIQILDDHSPVLLNFLSVDVENRAFGHIIDNRELRKQQYDSIAKLKNYVTHLDSVNVNNIVIHDDTVTVYTDSNKEYQGKLLIAADGKQSFVRELFNIPYHAWSYDQSAIVCCVEHQNPHNNIAIEHFRDEGPFAILPMNDDPKTGAHRSSLVWSVHGNDRRMMDCADDLFNIALQTRFPKFYGDVKLKNERAIWPLSLKHSHTYIEHRCVMIAEAAHAMHPIAGQGLNVGMRDIKVLCDLLVEARARGRDIGSSELLKTYQSKRHLDTSAMMAATDILNRLFSNKSKLLSFARKIGIKAVNQCPPAKTFFMHQAMGLGLKRQSK